MSSYLQRLFNRGAPAPSLAMPGLAIAPAARLASPLAEADQRLNLPGFVAPVDTADVAVEPAGAIVPHAFLAPPTSHQPSIDSPRPLPVAAVPSPEAATPVSVEAELRADPRPAAGIAEPMAAPALANETGAATHPRAPAEPVSLRAIEPASPGQTRRALSIVPSAPEARTPQELAEDPQPRARVAVPAAEPAAPARALPQAAPEAQPAAKAITREAFAPPRAEPAEAVVTPFARPRAEPVSRPLPDALAERRQRDVPQQASPTSPPKSAPPAEANTSALPAASAPRPSPVVRPLTAEAASVIGPLPVRRRTVSIFGMRRR
ncbi:hypothetical protein [Mesorhizobium sp. IMUNJ 23232]|uniref:hypothetical protein n=1 Tax=Mesorhizobium sp. IMUNJ 23232 TaxID=3376064 RepID=UPI0037A5E5F4